MAQANGIEGASRIGELAESLKTTTKTLRHYEKMGLIEPSGRTQSGYRVYDSNDKRRARIIVGLRSIGLSIPAIRELLQHNDQSQTVRQRLLGHLDEKLSEFDETLGVLQGRRDDLSARIMSLFDTPEDRNEDCICNALLKQCDCSNA